MTSIGILSEGNKKKLSDMSLTDLLNHYDPEKSIQIMQYFHCVSDPTYVEQYGENAAKTCAYSSNYIDILNKLLKSKLELDMEVNEEHRLPLRSFLDRHRAELGNVHVYGLVARAFDTLNAKKYPNKYPTRQKQVQAITDKSSTARTFEEWKAVYEDPEIPVYPIPHSSNERLLFIEVGRIISQDEKNKDMEALQKWHDFLHWENKEKKGTVSQYRESVRASMARVLFEPFENEVERSTTKEELLEIQKDVNLIVEETKATNEDVAEKLRSNSNARLRKRSLELIAKTNDENVLVSWTQLDSPTNNDKDAPEWEKTAASKASNKLAKVINNNNTAPNKPPVKNSNAPASINKTEQTILGMEPWLFAVVVGASLLFLIVIIALINAGRKKRKQRRQYQTAWREQRKPGGVFY